MFYKLLIMDGLHYALPKIYWLPDLAHVPYLQMDRLSHIYFSIWIDDQGVI